MADPSFLYLPQEFKDVNTGDLVKCGFDDQNSIADPDAWGMIRFHPHAPTQLLYPPAPTYVYELEGIPQEAILGVLAKTTKPGLAAGLEAVVNKLSDGLNRLEYPPGQRGNPLPVSEVVREEYARLFPQDDETNIYRMQVYTWRLSDVVRVCKKLLLDPDAIFRTRTSPEPPSALNFAGDRYYADDIRLREPNCEPLLSNEMIIDEGKYRVFRKMPPGYHPRDRPATYHDNYSEITGKPDPLHDFGIKHLRNDAGQVTQFRYACCWQAPGSPGCLITYPSKSASQTTRSDQGGGLEKLAGLPVLYTWFGGFPATKQTARFRGAAFVDRGYADALHEKITSSLTDTLVQNIATRAPLSASETRVIAQIAGWMHQYNTPLLGCALNTPPEEITMANVEAYLDRVVKDRTLVTTTTKPVPKATALKPVPKEVQHMIASAKLHGFDAKGFEDLGTAIEKGRDVTPGQIEQYRERLVQGVPLYSVVDTNDQWLLAEKRQRLAIADFDNVVSVLKKLTKDELSEKREVEVALLRPKEDRAQVLLDVQRDRKFIALYSKKDTEGLRTYAEMDSYLKSLFQYLIEAEATAPTERDEIRDLLDRFAKKRAFRGSQADMKAAFLAFQKNPLHHIRGLKNDLAFALDRELTDDNLEHIRETINKLLEEYKKTGINVTGWPMLDRRWTTDRTKSDLDNVYYIPQQTRAYFKDALLAMYIYLQDPSKSDFPSSALNRWRERRDYTRSVEEETDVLEFIKEYTDRGDKMLSYDKLEEYSGYVMSLLSDYTGEEVLRRLAGFQLEDANALSVKFVTTSDTIKTFDALRMWQSVIYSRNPAYFSGPNSNTIPVVPFPKTDPWRKAYVFLVEAIVNDIYKRAPDRFSFVSSVESKVLKIISQ